MSLVFNETELILNSDGSVYHLNLKPQHVADVVITVGDPGRVYRISRFFDKIEFEMNKREFITHVGTYKGKRITVISSGMGTENIEIMMCELDALANIDLKKREPKSRKKKLKVIRVGTSGSIQEDIRLGTHMMAEYGIGIDSLMEFYNLEQSVFETEVAQALQQDLGLPYPPYCVRGSENLLTHFADITTIGNTVTCNGFYASQGRQLRLPVRYPNIIDKLMFFHHGDIWLTNLEMETAALYAFGRMLGHETISLNAILANRVKNRFSKDPYKIVDSLIRKVLDKIVLL
ncbi:MAG: nucleoside phosphorylase [Cyclobacteriaceae bacterium]|nr:nucleoside phosphorylase [Cyclobacteriaceae bacterium]